MSRPTPIRALLMAAEIKEGGAGFHRLVFKVEEGRNGISLITVLISQDACRKLTSQLQRARVVPFDRVDLLKTWARWVLALRLDEAGFLPPTVTITASDLDDLGAYAMDFARALPATGS